MDLPAHANITFEEVESNGEPSRPLDFPAPVVDRGVRVNAFVVDLSSGTRNVWSVIHRHDFRKAALQPKGHFEADPTTYTSQYIAYAPTKRLQNAIYGSVWACFVLRRHYGVAADDAARATGVEPGGPEAPIVWETTNNLVAIKMVEWSEVHRNRGHLLEDPIKEVAAMQLIGNASPHVLGPIEVLQDSECLYSIMPYCSGGDLFGVVVKFAGESDGEIGMPEPVARYWFRQILKGLLHLQSVGVCHRDLSLENVLVDTNNCLIIDMGMCLYVPYNDPERPGSVTDATKGTTRRLMKPQGVCGKHNYMSPEIYSNTAAFDGFSIDLWAAGVILYIMLTGFPPYDQASRADQKFDIIVRGNLVRQLKDWGMALSDDAGDLLQSMLQLDPKDRLTLADVMSHPWVINGEARPPPPSTPLPYH
eukprot:CAMPEP_0116146008 /NCGR_PEP_ID=MMETSP0329-20121206/16927_1 /TAXON_ID=697910 /ORGANISM="Pseudo-nitzschia arenysensis, Strain B593" /LENGTH=419 /DNA_ID=CAMNT_0003641711 /DNA_START=155 /DNA_END=1414 /DNA_ORIENTATION=+